MRFSLTVEEKRGEPKFVNRGGVYTVGCIPIILGWRNSFLSAYGISCRWSPFFSSQRFFLNVLTCRADWILESRERNCERVATDFPFLCVLGKIFSLLADKLTNRFSICSLHIYEMLLRPRRKACLSAFSTVFKVILNYSSFVFERALLLRDNNVPF